MTDKLSDWLTCQLAEVLSDWLAELLTCWLSNWLIGGLADWLADLLTDLQTYLLTNLLTNWLADLLNYWPTVWLIDWLTDSHRLIDCLAGSLTNGLWVAGWQLRFMLRKEINFNALHDMNQNYWDCWWKWLIFISDQMCPADVTRLQQPLDLEVIFSAINAVYIAL